MPDLAAMLQSAAQGNIVPDLDGAIHRYASLSSTRQALAVILDELVAPKRPRPTQQREAAVDLAVELTSTAPLLTELIAMATDALVPQSGREAQAAALLPVLAESLQLAADVDAEDVLPVVKRLPASVRPALAAQPGFADRFGPVA